MKKYLLTPLLRQVVNILLLVLGLIWLLRAGFGAELGTAEQTNYLVWAVLFYIFAQD